MRVLPEQIQQLHADIVPLAVLRMPDQAGFHITVEHPVDDLVGSPELLVAANLFYRDVIVGFKDDEISDDVEIGLPVTHFRRG